MIYSTPTIGCTDTAHESVAGSVVKKSTMRKIPTKLREEMANDPTYSRCILTGRADEKIDWHHNLIYAGRQVNEKWCILPLLHSVHEIEKMSIVKERLDWIMLNRATDEELKRYTKSVDLKAKRDRLNKQFGIWRPNTYIQFGIHRCQRGANLPYRKGKGLIDM